MKVGWTMATIDLIGVPMDLGADRRGVDMGPSALRYAGVQISLEKLGHSVNDRGNISVAGPEQQRVQDRTAKYVEEIARTCKLLADQVAESIDASRVPLVVGGDHSIAMGTGLGLARSGRHFGTLWIDTHADINTPATSPSGNVHGMPIAALLGMEPAGMMKSVLHWEEPPLSPQRLALLGVRDVDPGERRALKEWGIRLFTMSDIDRQGIAATIDAALEYLCSQCDSLYVSFDLDVLDPSVAPGVGTPKEGGLTYREGHLVMETIAQSGQLSALEVVEINPILDVGNKTARVARDLIGSAFGASVV